MTNRKQWRGRRDPARMVDITDEFVNNLPAPISNSDTWYDKTLPRLACARSLSKGAAVRFQFRISADERRALGLMTGTPYIPMKAKTVAEARTEYNACADRVAQAMSIMKPQPESPEDILKPRPNEEHPQYERLMSVLLDAYAQATSGKGVERHQGSEEGDGGVSFEKQDMMKVMERVGQGFALGQAIKKIVEGNRLPWRKAREEFLGAIVYVAGAVVHGDRKGK